MLIVLLQQVLRKKVTEFLFGIKEVNNLNANQNQEYNGGSDP